MRESVPAIDITRWKHFWHGSNHRTANQVLSFAEATPSLGHTGVRARVGDAKCAHAVHDLLMWENLEVLRLLCLFLWVLALGGNVSVEAESWSRFRGPNGSGLSRDKGFPTVFGKDRMSLGGFM